MLVHIRIPVSRHHVEARRAIAFGLSPPHQDLLGRFCQTYAPSGRDSHAVSSTSQIVCPTFGANSVANAIAL